MAFLALCGRRWIDEALGLRWTDEALRRRWIDEALASILDRQVPHRIFPVHTIQKRFG